MKVILNEDVKGKGKKGDIVNLENDPVGKYVERFLTIPAEKTNDTTQEKGITLEMLTKYGF